MARHRDADVGECVIVTKDYYDGMSIDQSMVTDGCEIKPRGEQNDAI